MERRESRRAPCRAAVRIYVESERPIEFFHLDSADISSDGLFLQSDLLYPVGEWLKLGIAVPGRARTIRCRGRVVRVVFQRLDAGPGMAVQLHGLNDEERGALARMSAELVRNTRAPARNV